MAAALEGFLVREYPDRGLKISACRIDWFYYKPQESCSAVYRLQCRDKDNQFFEPWFYAKTPARSAEPILEKDAPAQWPGCAFWKPVSFWPEMDMVLHAFPYDRRLPHLGQLLESGFVRQQIEANLEQFGLPETWRCCEVNCHNVKYMPCKRCVLRYDEVL